MRLMLALISLAAWSQTFDDSPADRMRIFTDTYELALSKSNGAILGITDKQANASLTLGSRNGCLWGSSYPGPIAAPYRGGCSFAAGRPDAFTYNWDSTTAILTLTYQSAFASTQRVDVAVALAFQPSSFDMQLTIANRMGVTMQSLLFPSDILFADNSIQAGYLPYYLPGVRLKPDFFQAHKSISTTYPSARAFADFVALDVNGGRISWYAVNPDAPAPVVFGFQDDNKTNAGDFYAFHTFQTWVPDGGAFTTPIIRVRPGQGPDTAIPAYRVENAIADYPSLADKLGDAADNIAHAPLVKMDFRSIGRTFADLGARLNVVNAPAILHPVSYWPPAFDRNYPDFLPPDPAFGTIDDFHAFVDAAHSAGLYVMPYTNPTWWDDQSPTALAAPSIASLAVIGQAGNPVYETYGPNRGFVASPYTQGVTGRIASLMAQWRDQVPVDFVFQDQIGSRNWVRDFNPAAPDPQSYTSGWLSYAQAYSGQNLMTEDGWDRVAATETGFCGSLLTGATAWTPTTVRWGPGSRGNTAFGPGNWEPYPLGTWLFHDKVLFYHHDLDNLPMNAAIEVLTWNAAFGVMAGYYWPELRQPNPDWPAIAMAFQPAVLARTAGRMLTSYTGLAPGVTESRFDDLAVIANWNAASSYRVDGHTIGPSGFLARADDGSVAGGVFVDQFNGSPLSAGVHYLVIERTDGSLRVSQPSGADTPLTIGLPPDWDLSAGIEARQVTRGGQIIGTIPVTVNGSSATFFYAKTAGAALVDHYEITLASSR